MVTTSIEFKKAMKDLRKAILQDLHSVAKQSKYSMDKTLFFVSLPGGMLAVGRTPAATEGMVGRVAIGYSTLKGGLVEGYFWLELPKTANGMPKSIRILGSDGMLVKTVKIEYEGKPPTGNAREIRIQSVLQVGPNAYEIDGSIKFDDGWHHFKFLYY
jgi:hypothetical protein